MTPIHFNQEIYFRELDLEFDKLESTEDVESAEAATATMHKEWLDIKSVEASVPKGLSNLLPSRRAQKEKLEIEKELRDREASEKYHEQGEPREGDNEADLTQFARFSVSSDSTSEAQKPRTIPQLNA